MAKPRIERSVHKERAPKPEAPEPFFIAGF